MNNNFTFNVIKDNIDFTPVKANETDSGYDCKAYLPEGSIKVYPLFNSYQAKIPIHNHVVIPLGFSINVDQNFYYTGDLEHEYRIMKSDKFEYKLAFSLRCRSGMAFKQGLQLHYGTIDTTYGKLVSAMVYNTSNNVIKIEHGDRIAQLVPELIPLLNHNVNYVSSLEELNTGNRDGFGSTGIK